MSKNLELNMTRIQEYLVAIDLTISNLPNPIGRSTFGDLLAFGSSIFGAAEAI